LDREAVAALRYVVAHLQKYYFGYTVQQKSYPTWTLFGIDRTIDRRIIETFRLTSLHRVT